MEAILVAFSQTGITTYLHVFDGGIHNPAIPVVTDTDSHMVTIIHRPTAPFLINVVALITVVADHVKIGNFNDVRLIRLRVRIRVDLNQRLISPASADAGSRSVDRVAVSFLLILRRKRFRRSGRKRRYAVFSTIRERRP